MRINIETNSTNTSAIIMDGHKILASSELPVNQSSTNAITLTIQSALSDANITATQIKAVMISASLFANAFTERKQLSQVAIVRLALSDNCSTDTNAALMKNWPQELIEIVHGETYQVNIDHENNNSELSSLNVNNTQMKEITQSIKQRSFAAVAISCVFAPASNEMEQQAANIIQQYQPDVSITLSSDIGRMGLLERENAAIINASLSVLSVEVVNSFKQAIKSLNIQAPFFVSQNNGPLMNAETVAKYPVLTLTSATNNNHQETAFLSSLKLASSGFANNLRAGD